MPRRLQRRRRISAFEDALALARAGDPSGFDYLFRRSSGELLAFARARGSADPDVIVNECLVRAFGKLDEFVGDERSFRAWCFAICRNLLIDESRYRARRPRLTGDTEVIECAGPDVTAEHVLDAIGTDNALAALALLTPDQREVVALRVVADLSISEVAMIVGKPESAVKALQHRGLRALSRQISREAVSDLGEVTLS